MIEEKLSNLTINQLTEEQYMNAKANGEINENELYMTPDDGSNKENHNTNIKKGTLEYHSKIDDSKVDTNEWVKIGNIVSISFRGCAETEIENSGILLTLPFKPVISGTPLVFTGTRYYPDTVKFAWFAKNQNYYKTDSIPAGKYVHVYFTYMTEE